jgi:endonuclease YncB( thermonuclease family)
LCQVESAASSGARRDTPARHHPRKPVQCFGPEAAAFTQARLEGQRVRLEGDVERHGIYRRRLAYVYFHARLFEDELLTRGYARLFVRAEPRARAHHARRGLDARGARVGLWGAYGDGS